MSECPHGVRRRRDCRACAIADAANRANRYDWAAHDRANRDANNRVTFERLLREASFPLPSPATWRAWNGIDLCDHCCWPEDSPSLCPRCSCCVAEFNDCDWCPGGSWTCVGREPPMYTCHVWNSPAR